MRRLVLLAALTLGLGTFPGTANAGIITGQLSFAGAVQVDATSTEWFEFLQLTDPGGPGSLDDVYIGVNPNIANITNSSILNGGVVVPGLQPPNELFETDLDLTTMTPGTALDVQFFEYGLNATNINFVLNFVSPCPGADYTCFGTSPYGFIQNDDGSVTIALSLSGTVFDVATPTLVSQWSGLWTTNIPDATIAQVFAVIESGGTISNSYSATKIAAFGVIPEPATLLTFGVGALVAARARRKNKKA